MACLQGIDPSLRVYIKDNQLPEIYEALLTGLIIECPDEPLKWIVEKIKAMRTDGMDSLSWYMFLSAEHQPKIKNLAESYVERIFKLEVETKPTYKMVKMAYEHYNHAVQAKSFGGWVKYFRNKKERQDATFRKMQESRLYYRHRLLRIHLYKIKAWKDWVKSRQITGFKLMAKVWNESISRLVFRAWHAVAVDARKTREYFERLERGELDEDAELADGELPSESYRDDISLLPRKCAIQIFGNLDLMDLGRCARVCRAWKVITGAPSLWSHLDFSKVKIRVIDKVVIQSLQKCRPYLVHLNLRQCFNLHWASFKCISECKNLQDLNLSECKGVNDEVMRTIAEGCPTLLYLNISHTEITDGTLRTLSRCCLNMQYLSLAYCLKYSDRGLHYLAAGKGCKKLTYLDLSGCLQVTPMGYKHIAMGCTSIQTFILNDLYTLSDLCIQNFADKCMSIRYISLLGSCNISDLSFKALSQGKKIQKIRIEGNAKISDNTFKTFGKLCPYLCHIYVVDCQRITDMMLKALAPLRNMVVINVADCVRISDSGVRQMVEGPSGSKIRELNLTNCVRVSDVSLLRIAQRCSSLTHLSLCFCEHVTDAGIELLGNMPSLTYVDLSGTNIQDQGLASLGVNRRIRSIVLSECSGITNLGLQKFCQQVKELEAIDVSHCMILSDAAIKNLAFCCRMLTSLNISGCPMFTDLSMQYLSGVCHYIHILNISGCIHISDRALRYLRKGCKQIRQLNMLYCKSITKITAQRIATKIEKVEYSNDEVPAWFNYAHAPASHKASRIQEPAQFIDDIGQD